MKSTVSPKTRPLHPSYCFYAAIWGIIAGIAFSLATNLTFAGHLPYLLLACLVILLSCFLPSRLTLILAFLAGFTLANFRIAPDFTSQDYLSQFVGQQITISGTISEDPDFSSGATLRLTQLTLGDTPLSGTLYVQFAASPSLETLERSDHLTLEGKLGAGFGTFVGTLYRPTLTAITKPIPGDVFARFKSFFASLVHDHIESPAADLGLGYLMGMKSGLPEDFSEALRIVGMTHVVVASGAHLAILTGAVKKFFGKISRFASLLFGTLLVLAFALVVGFTPSMTRAALVALLTLWTAYVGRSFTPLRLLSFVAAVTLLISPSNLLNLGWQLSFASFFGILIVAPRLTKLLYGGKSPPWLASMLLTSLSTTLICAPILLYNFGSLSLLSFIANLVILPTLPYAMLLTLLTGATSFFAPLAQLFATLATLLLNLHIWLVNFLSDKTIFVLTISPANPLIFLLYLPILLCLLLPTLKQLRKHRKNLPTPTNYDTISP